MSTIAIYKIFGEKNVDSFDVAPRKRVSRRSMRTYSLNDVRELPPTLVLTSLWNPIQSKRFELFDRIKIGRQVSPKTSPDPKNGYFDSKVLSRTHAEVWSENGQVYVKDLKSSNGTYLNERRLSPEGVESQPHELRNGDLLEFGIDILETEQSEFKKVSCRVSILRESLVHSRDVAPPAEKSPCTPRLNQRSIKDTTSKSPIPGNASPARLEAWKSRLKTELNSLTDAGFEVTELASVLQDITNELYGHKHVTSESSSLQDLGQVKAELTRFKDRCRSLEHALRESNKTLHAVMSKPASPHMEKGTIGREGRSDKERVQQVAHIMEDRQVFGDESSKQQLLYNKKVAGYLKMNREYRQENILETKQSMLAIHGSHQERHDGLEATKIKGNGSRYANCNGQGHGRGHDTPKFLDDAPLTAEPAMTQGGEFSDNATRKPPTSVRGYKQSPLSLIQ